MNEPLAEPAACPACKEAWNAAGQCPRCGLLRDETIALMRNACAAFAQAREAAFVGQFSEAQKYLKQARGCGIEEIARHPAVERLAELCAAASGDMGARTRLLAGEEQAARSAAARGDFRAAAFYAGRAAAASPGALPLQKLYLLTLYGAGRMKEAANVRQELRRAAPADANLIRWRMAELDAIDRIPESPVTAPKKMPVALALSVGCAVGVALVLLTGKRRKEQVGRRTEFCQQNAQSDGEGF